jgi:hypothetical protein
MRLRGDAGVDRRSSLLWILVVVASVGGAHAAIGDLVVVENATTADDVVLGLYGKHGAEPCRNTAYRLTDNAIDVGDVRPSAACSSEATVFAKRHALATTSVEWTSGDDEFRAQIGPALREIHLDVYVVATGARAEDWARSDIARARTVFDKNRTGLTFVEGRFRASSSLTPAEVAVIGHDCTQVDDLKASSLYADDRVNVYFVYAIGGDGENTPRGRTCYEPVSPGNVDGAPDIIYISTYRHTPTTLSHELGHAFGLRGTAGHTGSEEEVWIGGFEQINIMWTGVDADEGSAKRHFSLGQGFRMSADERSWLNRAGAVSGGPTLRRCHPSGALNESPCPPLAFDVPQ